MSDISDSDYDLKVINVSATSPINSSFLDPQLLERFTQNLRITDPWATLLICCYSCIIIFGAVGNCMVIAAVVRKQQMRTVRNVFVVNLASSDLLLCLITMPLTLMEILTMYWPLGHDPVVCKIAGTLQGTSIFVSTLSITAIALDRHQLIVYPTQTSLQMVGATLALLGIWIISVVLALPNFIWRTLETHNIYIPGITKISFCFENWPSQHGRALYSGFVMIVQYCFPILTVSTAYARICNRLSYRGRSGTVQARRIPDSNEKKSDDTRMRKTNTLLVAIALMFCLSWLPLNLFNIVVDINNPFGEDTEVMLIIYAVCHMVGMSSACSNPVLYGWLNGNFRKEFFDMFACLFPCCEAHLQVNSDSTVSRHPRQSRIGSAVTMNLKPQKKIETRPLQSKQNKSEYLTTNGLTIEQEIRREVNKDTMV